MLCWTTFDLYLQLTLLSSEHKNWYSSIELSSTTQNLTLVEVTLSFLFTGGEEERRRGREDERRREQSSCSTSGFCQGRRRRRRLILSGKEETVAQSIQNKTLCFHSQTSEHTTTKRHTPILEIVQSVKYKKQIQSVSGRSRCLANSSQGEMNRNVKSGHGRDELNGHLSNIFLNQFNI